MGELVHLHLFDDLLQEYKRALSRKASGTQAEYLRAANMFIAYISRKPGTGGQFNLAYFTPEQVERYLKFLQVPLDPQRDPETYRRHSDWRKTTKYSENTLHKQKQALSHFALWLMDRGDLHSNPVREAVVPPVPLLAPIEFTQEQREALLDLVDRCANLRGKAIFALGFWAGCRVSDVSHLKLEDVQIGPKKGVLKVGYKGGKTREIDLLNEARRPLFKYLQEGRVHRMDSPYVFPSQKSDRLTENAIGRWFKKLKEQATIHEWELIKNIKFHDMRHDFGHRALKGQLTTTMEAWTLQEVAYYLGHVTKKGTPAIQTTARYTAVSRRDIARKMGLDI